MRNTARKASREPEVQASEDIDWTKAKVVGRGIKTGRRFDLRALRTAVGKSQADIARTAEMDQGDVSRLESREDMKLSTLTRYAVALGGELDVAVVIDGRRYKLDV
jgi:hypothetical protein